MLNNGIRTGKEYLAGLRDDREIWTKVIAGRDIISDDLLLRSTGERVTDGVTAANIIWILTTEKRPAVYLGKSPKEGTSVNISIQLDEIRESQFIKDNSGNQTWVSPGPCAGPK